MQQQPEQTYQGRRLPKPHEEVTDQGLGFDLGTLMNRRQLLRVFGAGAATLGIAACGSEPAAGPAGRSEAAPARTASTGTAAPSAVPAEIPEETRGPFPGDGSNGPDILERSGVVRSDIRPNLGSATAADGVRLDLELTVSDLADGGRPLTGAAVYVWQCDRAGRYSMYGDGVTRQTFLRGVQIVDSAGKVRFTSVFPGCYPGRWPHVHFEIYPDRGSIADHATVIATSQVAFPEKICDVVYEQAGYQGSAANLADLSLENDIVFRDDGAVTQLASVTGDATGGYLATLAVRTRTR